MSVRINDTQIPHLEQLIEAIRGRAPEPRDQLNLLETEVEYAQRLVQTDAKPETFMAAIARASGAGHAAARCWFDADQGIEKELWIQVPGWPRRRVPSWRSTFLSTHWLTTWGCAVLAGDDAARRTLELQATLEALRVAPQVVPTGWHTAAVALSRLDQMTTPPDHAELRRSLNATRHASAVYARLVPLLECVHGYVFARVHAAPHRLGNALENAFRVHRQAFRNEQHLPTPAWPVEAAAIAAHAVRTELVKKEDLADHDTIRSSMALITADPCDEPTTVSYK